MRSLPVLFLLCACAKPRPAAPPTAPAPVEEATPAAADDCPGGGWASAIVVDGQYESGFEPTIAWNRHTRQPLVFDVAQESDENATHWLRVAERGADGWPEPSTLEGMVSGVMAAGVDDQGLVHLVFTRFDAGGGPFLGTIGPGVPWKVEGPIEPGLGFIQDRMSMLLGAGGEVVIAYSDQPTRTVKVAARRAGAWTLETVATGASLMNDHTLVRDSHGGLHLVASDWSSGELRLHSRASDGSWPFVAVAPHASGASLAVDAADRLHVSWVDWEKNELRHGVGPAGGPLSISLVASGDLGNDTSIAVAKGGTVRIAYDQRDCGDLHLATLAPDAGEWSTELVDSQGEVGADSELVVDDGGCVHLVYGDSEAWDLKYATRCP